MAEIIDVRGLACPEPVVQTKKAILKHNEFKILCDSNTAKENILRYCGNLKVTTKVSETGDGWEIEVAKNN